MVQIFEPDPRRIETVFDRVDGKACRVLETIEAFLFGRGDQPAVLNNGRRCVAVIGVDPEYVHDLA